MAFQGEREPGVVGMDLELVESMAQDEIPEQDIPVQDEFPQPNPEPEMGAAAAEAAVYDTSPPPPKPPEPCRIGSAECTRHDIAGNEHK